MTSRIGINPLPWVLTRSGFDLRMETLLPALKQLAGIGFTGLQADVPDGVPVAQYRDLLAEYGFLPAPSYFGAHFADPNHRSIILERARAIAEQQSELGLAEIFIAEDGTAARLRAPARGVTPHQARTSRIADGLAATAAVFARSGIRAALHPHVGTWIETEQEIRDVLDQTDGSDLAFGPDTGHLAWAGIDPVTVIRDYRPRCLAVHLKDIDPTAVTTARDAQANYAASAYEHHVWTEPGRGSVDFPSVRAVLNGFTGWYVVEVDVPNLDNAHASSRASFDYLAPLLGDDPVRCEAPL